MPFVVGDKLAEFFKWFYGEEFPGLLPERFNQLGRQLFGVADVLDDAGRSFVSGVETIRGGVRGESEKAFVAAADRVAGLLKAGPEFVRTLGQAMVQFAALFFYVQVTILAITALLLIELLIALKLLWINPALFLEWVAKAPVVRQAFYQTFVRVVGKAAMGAAFNMIYELLVDVAAQLAGRGRGYQRGWNRSATGDAAKGGALEALVGGVFGAGKGAARRLGGGRALGGVAGGAGGGSAGRGLAGHAASSGGRAAEDAAEELTTEVVSGLVLNGGVVDTGILAPTAVSSVLNNFTMEGAGAVGNAVRGGGGKDDPKSGDADPDTVADRDPVPTYSAVDPNSPPGYSGPPTDSGVGSKDGPGSPPSYSQTPPAPPANPNSGSNSNSNSGPGSGSSAGGGAGSQVDADDEMFPPVVPPGGEVTGPDVVIGPDVTTGPDQDVLSPPSDTPSVLVPAGTPEPAAANDPVSGLPDVDAPAMDSDVVPSTTGTSGMVRPQPVTDPALSQTGPPTPQTTPQTIPQTGPQTGSASTPQTIPQTGLVGTPTQTSGPATISGLPAAAGATPVNPNSPVVPDGSTRPTTSTWSTSTSTPPAVVSTPGTSPTPAPPGVSTSGVPSPISVTMPGSAGQGTSAVDGGGDLPLAVKQPAVQVEPADQRVMSSYSVDDTGSTADLTDTDAAPISTPGATSAGAGPVVVPVVEGGRTRRSSVRRVVRRGVDESDQEVVEDLPLEGVDLPESALLVGVRPLEDPAPAEQVQPTPSQGPAPNRSTSEPTDPGSVPSSSAASLPDTMTALRLPTLPEATWSTPNDDRSGVVGGSVATASPTAGGSVADTSLPRADDARAVDAYPWLASVNPDGSATNCVLVAIAADMSLQPGETLTWAAPAESGLPESDLVAYQRQQLGLSDHDVAPIFRTSIGSVRTTMATAPPGSRGVLLVRDPAAVAGVGASHAFNVVVRDDGVVDFLDAQRADWARDPNESDDLYFLPMNNEIGVPEGSYAVDPAELDGYAEGVATEVERSAIVVPRPGVDPNFSPVLARRRAGPGVDTYDMEVTLDKKTYFQGSDGLFHPDRRSARGPGQQEPTGTTFHIIEDRVHPTVADPRGDSGRPSWDSVFREIRGVGERLASAPLWQSGQPGLPIEMLYPPEEGWEITPDGQGAQVFVPFRDDSLYVQWNIGLPIGDGLGMARWLASDPHPPIFEAQVLLRGGIEFGRDVVAQYLGVPPNEAESYLYLPEVAQLWDFMVHTYTHVSAVAEHDAAKVGMLLKNLLSIGLRNPLDVVRKSLPDSVRLFLEVNAPTIRQMWTARFHRHITSESAYRDEYERRHGADGIDYLRLQTPEVEGVDDRVTIGQYLDNALLDNPETRVEQLLAVGLNSGSGSDPFEKLDNNQGRSKESAVYEIRRLRLERVSVDQMDEDHTRIVGLIGDLRAEGEHREGDESPQRPLANQITEFLRATTGRVSSSGPVINKSQAEEISRQLGSVLVGSAHPLWPQPLLQTRQQLGELGQQLQDYAVMPDADGGFASSRAQDLQKILGQIDSLLASSDDLESLTDLYFDDGVDDSADGPESVTDLYLHDAVDDSADGPESVTTGWLTSGAGPAGEFTEVITSGLDDVTVHEQYPWLRQVNPDRSATNCVITAITTEMNLRPGESMTWSAPGTPPNQDRDNGDADLLPTVDLVNYQRDQLDLAGSESRLFRTDLDSVRAAMSGSPVNSRAIVLVRGAGQQVSHAFNVIHDDNGVVFLDGQTGGLARTPETVEEWILIPLTDGITPPPGATVVDPNDLTGRRTGMNGNTTPADSQLGPEAGSSTGPGTRAGDELRTGPTAAGNDDLDDRDDIYVTDSDTEPDRSGPPVVVSPGVLGLVSDESDTETGLVAGEDVAETNRRLVGDFDDFVDRINAVLAGPGTETVAGRAYAVIADGDASLAEVGGLELLRVDTRVPDSVPAGYSLVGFDTYWAVRHGDQTVAFVSPEDNGGVAVRITGPITTSDLLKLAGEETGMGGDDTDTTPRSGPASPGRVITSPDMRTVHTRILLTDGINPPPGATVVEPNDLAGQHTGTNGSDDTPAPLTSETMPDLAEVDDLRRFVKVGEKKGSNLGGVYQGPDGRQWYVKVAKTPVHAANEVAASALYRLAGVDTPQVRRGRRIPEFGSQLVTYTALVPGAVEDLRMRMYDPAYLEVVRSGFAIDVWLANWDVAGTTWSNIVTGGDGLPYRIDVGGALLFRAQGGRKGAAFGATPNEIESMRDPDVNRETSMLFGQMTDEQLRNSVGRLAALTDDSITRIVGAAGLDPEVARLLIERRDYLLEWAGADELPGARAPGNAGDPQPTYFAPNVLKMDTGWYALSFPEGQWNLGPVVEGIVGIGEDLARHAVAQVDGARPSVRFTVYPPPSNHGRWGWKPIEIAEQIRRELSEELSDWLGQALRARPDLVDAADFRAVLNRLARSVVIARPQERGPVQRWSDPGGVFPYRIDVHIDGISSQGDESLGASPTTGLPVFETMVRRSLAELRGIRDELMTMPEASLPEIIGRFEKAVWRLLNRFAFVADAGGDALADVGGLRGPLANWSAALQHAAGIRARMKRVARGGVFVDGADLVRQADHLTKLLDESALAWTRIPYFDDDLIWYGNGSDPQHRLMAIEDGLPRRVSADRPTDPFAVALRRDINLDALRITEHSDGRDVMMWRTDRHPLYRVDLRKPEEIVSGGGFAPWNNKLPADLFLYTLFYNQYALVATSRSARFAADFRDGYVYEIDAPGGIDLNATQRRYVITNQQEVVFPGGIRSEFIVRANQVGADGKLVEVWTNPRYSREEVDALAVEAAAPAARVASPVAEQAAEGSVVPVPVVVSNRPGYDGPHDGVSELPGLVHRGEFEVEYHGGAPHVRVYSVVSNRQNLHGDALGKGRARADVADVAQDPRSGRIVIAEGERDRPLTVIGGRPLAALKLVGAMTRYQRSLGLPEGNESAPLVRSFLLPLPAYEALTRNAVGVPAWGGDLTGVTSIRGELEPNVFAVPFSQADEQLAAHAVAGSLRTYTDHPHSLPSVGRQAGAAGVVESLSVLRDRLGVPERELNPEYDPWPIISEVQEGTVDAAWSGRVAAELRGLLVTWWQSQQQEFDRRRHALTEGDEPVAFYHRRQALDAFLAAHGIDDAHGSDAAHFMTRVVEPWATQAAIAHTLVEEHERLRRDLTITDEVRVEDFASLRLRAEERDEQLRQLGAELDELWHGNEPDAVLRMVDRIQEALPELAKRFDEFAVVGLDLLYDEHVQMVLGQYRVLTEADRNPRTAVIAKAILFHDIDKINSKRQYGDGRDRHDAEPEHILAVELIQRYAPLFGDASDLRLVLGLVDSDPFGFYLRDRHGPQEVFSYIARLAFEVDGRDTVDGPLSDRDVARIQQMYRAAHQYYQADFSSYTRHASYQPREEESVRNGRRHLDHHFAETPDGRLRLVDGRFDYAGAYVDRMASLDRVLADPEQVRSWYAGMRDEQGRAQAAAALVSRYELADDPLRLVTQPGQDPQDAALAVAAGYLGGSAAGSTSGIADTYTVDDAVTDYVRRDPATTAVDLFERDVPASITAALVDSTLATRALPTTAATAEMRMPADLLDDTDTSPSSRVTVPFPLVMSASSATPEDTRVVRVEAQSAVVVAPGQLVVRAGTQFQLGWGHGSDGRPMEVLTEVDPIRSESSDGDVASSDALVESVTDRYVDASSDGAIPDAGQPPTGSYSGPSSGGGSANGLSGAGPAGEFTQVIPSHLDDSTVHEAYPWLRSVNPDRSETNCVLTAITTEMNLRPGETMTWSAPGTAPDEDNGDADLLPTLDLVNYQRDQLNLTDPDSRLFRTDLESVRSTMSTSPINSRAVLLVRGAGKQVSHAFNVVHDGNGVVFLDGQTGGLARTPETVEDWILIPLTDGINPPPGATSVDPSDLTGQHSGMNDDDTTPATAGNRQRDRVEVPAVAPPPVNGTMTEEESLRASAALPDGSAWEHLLLTAAPPGYLVYSPYPSDQWQHPGLIYVEQSGWQVPVAASRIQPLPGVVTIVVAVSPDLPSNAVANALADVVIRVYGGDPVPPLRVLVSGVEGENHVILDLVDRLPGQVEVIGPLGEWAVGTDGALLDPTETGPGWGHFRTDQDPQVEHGLAVQVRGTDAAARPAPYGNTGERLAGWVSLVLQISGGHLMDRVTGLHRAFYGDVVEADSLVEFADATNAQWTSARFGGVVWDVIRHGPGSSALVELRNGSGQLALVAVIRNEERGIFLINLVTGAVTPLSTAPIFAGTARVILRDPSGEPQSPSAPDQLPAWWQRIGSNQALDVRTNGDLAVHWADSGLVISSAQAAPADPRPADVLSDWLTINVAVAPETRARPLARVIAPLLRSLYPAGPPPIRVLTDGVDGRNRFAEHLSGLLPPGTSIAAPGGTRVHSNDGSIQVEGVGTDLHWVRYVAGSFPQPGVQQPIADRIQSYYPNPEMVPGEDLYRETDDDGDEDEGLDGNPVLASREPSSAVVLVDDQGEQYGLTPFAVRRWTEDNGVDLPDSQVFEEQLVEVLYPAEETTPREYRVDEAALFVQQVQARVFDQLAADQETVLEAVELAGQWILRQFPPDQFVYVGLGRSPAAIIAALPRLDHRVRSANLPLSAFRPGPAEPNSILATTLDQPPADPDQLAMLHRHFDEFLGDLPTDRPIVVIDIADTGRSLISVQHHLQRHLDAIGRPQVVYALGVDYALDVPSAEITAIATPVPGEPAATVEARRQWASRFRVLRLGTNSPLAPPYNRVLAEALGQEAFDGLAEYGSYPLLSQPARYFEQDRPRRGTDAQQGYGVLQDALDEHSGSQRMSVDEITMVPGSAGLGVDGSAELGPSGRGQLAWLPGGQPWQLGSLPVPVAAVASSAQRVNGAEPMGVGAGLAAAVATLPAWEQGADRVPRVSAVLDRLGVGSATRDGADSPASLAARLGGRFAPIRPVDLAGLGFGTSTVVWVAEPDDQRHVVIAHRGLDGRVWWVQTQTAQGSSPFTRVRFAGEAGMAAGDVASESDRWAAAPLWAVVNDRGGLVEIGDSGQIAGSDALVRPLRN
ncbi:toxin glutamine deamidase domain-containing protein [Micromonospora sp. NPDC050276]|uniref:scabin-related ADP-ribosyltransferase n=1 Tax=Micromonospora sp. NPDC050276 TaxID=3364278 RepID=UPI0037B81DE2